MTTKTAKYSLSRKQAAQILDVSTRTLDRYIRSRKLSARKKGGTILLSEEEVSNFKTSRFQNMHGASPEAPGRVHRHVDNTQKEPATVVNGETGQVEVQTALEPKAETTAIAKPENGVREQVFEELYDLSRREIREYHNKLEAANYRLGRLETQIKHSVPLLEYQEKSEALREQEDLMGTKLKRQGESMEILEQELSSERLNKNIYIGLLFGLLALQPLLWLLLQG